MAGLSELEIRDVTRLDDFYRLAEIQKVVWQIEPEAVTSPYLLMAQQRLGAVVLAAYDTSGKIAGFVYGFLGLRNGLTIHWSHMLAVLPEFRGIGLGKLLKWKQRERVLELGIDLCCWTFDPAVAVNTRLNVYTLGATIEEYRVNYYDTREGQLDGGMPTDRFVAKWVLNSPSVQKCAAGSPQHVNVDHDELPLLCDLEERNGILVPLETKAKLNEEFVGFPIPPGIKEARASDPESALHWRMVTREIITAYFERGYRLVDVFAPKETGNPHFTYVLQKS